MPKSVIELAPLYRPITHDMSYGSIERVCSSIAETGQILGEDIGVIAVRGSMIDIPKLIEVESEDYEKQALYALGYCAISSTVIHTHRRSLFGTEAWKNINNHPETVTTLHGPACRVNDLYKDIVSPNMKFTTLSKFQLDNLNDSFNVVATIPNGVDVDFFNPNNFEHDDYLLHIGRVCEDKGQADSIKIVKNKRAKLIIAGPIDDPNYFKQEIEPHLNDNIQFLGDINRDYIKKLLESAKALILPAHWDDPYPLVVLEAQSMGVPVLGYRRGGMVEQVENGVSGYLVDNVDSLDDAVNMVESLDRKLIRKRILRNFSWSIITKQYFELFSSIK